MKVTVKNVTGSQNEEALLDKDSGVLEFKDGRISHVLFELNFSKQIHVVKEVKKEEVKEEIKTPSEVQSAVSKKAETKRKSK